MAGQAGLATTKKGHYSNESLYMTRAVVKGA